MPWLARRCAGNASRSTGPSSALPRAGSALENPFVYDAVAREFEQMAQRGLVEIVQEHKSNHGEPLIDSLRFLRVRIG